MAENKKSFLLYCDTLLTVKKLTDQKAGKLFKIILMYVNDENPTVDDLVVDLAFEPIKQQLKRDLKKYEAICDRNKSNGGKGGRPQKETQKKPKKPSGLIWDKKNEKNNPSITQNNLIYDTDTDTDTDIESSKEDIKPPITTHSEIDFLKFKNWISQNAPQVSKMKEPFTIDEFEKLKLDFDVGFIQNLIQAMHNYKPLLQKNQSANLTFRNWAKREIKNGKTFNSSSKVTDLDAIVDAVCAAHGM